MLRIYLLFAWLVMIVVTWLAVKSLGIDWPSIFFGDILNNEWRAQFNIDFLFHLILFCSWVIWRERSKLVGVVCGILCIFGGGLFGFMYLFFVSLKSEGNVSKFFLGKHYKTA